MLNGSELILTGAFAIAAFLYASVGHAGASGYLVAMAMIGMVPATMRPVALLLNLVVATIALIQFSRTGSFSWRLFWPFALGSVPFACLGGSLMVHGEVYRILVAIGLIVAAYRLALPSGMVMARPLIPVPPMTAIVWGAAIGFVAGITGTGGGIYLSPLLLFCRWGEPRDTGGVAAAFILVNSLAGIIGSRPDLATLPNALPQWMAVVAIFGFCGAWVGSRRARPLVFKRLLAGVLGIAAVKLVMT